MSWMVIPAGKQPQECPRRTYSLIDPSVLQERHEQGARPSLAVDRALRVEFDIRETSVFQNVVPQPLPMLIERIDVKPVVKGRFLFQWKPDVLELKTRKQ